MYNQSMIAGGKKVLVIEFSTGFGLASKKSRF
jgi:trans-2-enoyl-CoA reductase